jgi:hypothetical protein
MVSMPTIPSPVGAQAAAGAKALTAMLMVVPTNTHNAT